ncbi:uncharacterized protein LOC127804845 isoform X2 [Diospyros lotus]|uniref:uncharacterized protein LOC127804845 isoform X2 n=1 Tax=Diospyros lotus TaxID=55363 RepID=UPI00224D4350|nr:uncharacterized protein LOC127804845 isoform X2 [Diospyros lotus]
MLDALKLKVSCPAAIASNCDRSLAGSFTSRNRSLILRLPQRRLASLSLLSHSASSEPSLSSQFTSTVGSASPSFHLSHWNLTHRHILLLNVIACAAAVSATWLFCSAIPTLLAFKRAAESLEKLMDVTREELPDTMATVRLSGMEISDLTMELSDLGQEITQGVRSSTRAVHVAEERLRSWTKMSPSESLQAMPTLKARTPEATIAKTARGMKEAIVKVADICSPLCFIKLFSKVRTHPCSPLSTLTSHYCLPSSLSQPLGLLYALLNAKVKLSPLYSLTSQPFVLRLRFFSHI